MMKLGQQVNGYGKIPAGSDANGLWPVFTAGSKPVLMLAGSVWGGDAGEAVDIYQLPPMAIKGGASDPSDFGGDETNAINVYGNIKEGGTTNIEKGALFMNSSRVFMIIPPYHMLALAARDPNAVTWKITLQGFELV